MTARSSEDGAAFTSWTLRGCAVFAGLPSAIVNMNMPWQPPTPVTPARRWLPAAIIGAAIVIAAGLVAGAFVLKDRNSGPSAAGSTCQAWKQTRLTLLAVPSLPNGWSWTTPDIDNAIRLQNAPVGNALGIFETQIVSDPADVAEAARELRHAVHDRERPFGSAGFLAREAR